MNFFSIREQSYLARFAAWKLKGANAALVLGRHIHLHGVSKAEFMRNEQWLRHELKHVEQFKRHGFIPFLVKYLWECVLHGYENCSFEREARAAEKDENLLAMFQYKGNESRA